MAEQEYQRSPEPEYVEIDLREYLEVLWSGKWIIIGLLIIAILTTGIVTQYFMEPVYQTETTIRLTNIEGIYSDSNNAVHILKSTNLISPIMKNLGEDYSQSELVNYIDENIKINNLENTKIINIKINNNEPELAYKLANNIVDKFAVNSRESTKKIITNKKETLQNLKEEKQFIENKIKNTNEEIDNITSNSMKAIEKNILINGLTNKLSSYQEQKNKLLGKINELKNELDSYYDVEILDSPYLPQEPISPNLKLNLAIAGVLSLMIGVFIVFFREFLNQEELL
ncbi:MAG: Wzz/FepE/Etk N-terminal domain-containing protein [Bacillota bacterium]